MDKIKVFIFGDQAEKIKQEVLKSGMEIVNENPEFVISYGGDGTLMRSERAFPKIPKIALKNSAICKKCSPLPNAEILKRVSDGKYQVEKIMKIEVAGNGRKLLAVNDITLHNADPRHGIRYRVWVNDRDLQKEIIGDGIVAATPFGSTAYYRSITDSFFEVGMGLAFNNSTEQVDHMVVDENSRIKIKITRGPAVVYVDNHEETIDLHDGDEILIKKSEETASILKFV